MSSAYATVGVFLCSVSLARISSAETASRRMRLQTVLLTVAALIWGGQLVLVGAVSTAYRVTRITDSAGVISTFQTPAVNDQGVVAFVANLDDGSSAILTGDETGLLTVADTSQFPFGFGQILDLSNDGSVAFVTLDSSGLHDAVYKWSNGTLSRVADRSGPIGVIDALPLIGRRGEVLFRAELLDGTKGIFTASEDRQPEYLVGSRDGLLDVERSFGINKRGDLVVKGVKSNGTGIFVKRGAKIITLATTAAVFQAFSDSPSISDKGVAAFHAILYGGPGVGGIITATTQGTLTQFAGANYSLIGLPRISASGTVIFPASRQGVAEWALYAGADPDRDRVIGTGDSLDGQTVTGLAWFRGLSDLARLAMVLILDDGSHAVYRADPI